MIPLKDLKEWVATYTVTTPNQGARPAKVQGIVGGILHATADRYPEVGDPTRHELGSVTWMQNAQAPGRPSCQLLIHRSGATTRLVPDARRSHHAGRSYWEAKDLRDVNSYTLGWEFCNNNKGEKFTDAQYETAAVLGAFYCFQGLGVGDFTSHEVIAPRRKTDPYRFDWVRWRQRVQFYLDQKRIPVPDVVRVHHPDAPQIITL